jgi:hypothetical protein
MSCSELLLLLLSEPTLHQWVTVAVPGAWMGVELIMVGESLVEVPELILLLWWILCSSSVWLHSRSLLNNNSSFQEEPCKIDLMDSIRFVRIRFDVFIFSFST